MGFLTSSFNPIKVLFLLNWTFDVEFTVFFQSYQGSIFTYLYLFVLERYPVLSILSRFYFYLRINKQMCKLLNFQSYQGSIFTFNDGADFGPDSLLSILSRFYFYAERFEYHNWAHHLSILSRFYFYNVNFNETGFYAVFQSYQGSIFTRKSNYIKHYDLSILSRFYFYAPQLSSTYGEYDLSILSRFYFYQDT